MSSPLPLLKQLVLRLVWLLIHALIAVSLEVYYLVDCYVRRRRGRRRQRRLQDISDDNDDDLIAKDVGQLMSRLTKMPTHIAVCLHEDRIDANKLIQLIRWCRQFQVKYVSLFSDMSSDIIANNLLSTHAINGRIDGSQQQQQQLIPTSLDNKTKSTNNNTNGYKLGTDSYGCRRPLDISVDNDNNENLKIAVFTHTDSRASIVRAAKQLTRTGSPAIELADITRQLKKTYEFPDPELLISFGQSTGVYGYPLWQLRLTEIYFYRSLRDFQFDMFYETLAKYSKCEQRFGK